MHACSSTSAVQRWPSTSAASDPRAASSFMLCTRSGSAVAATQLAADMALLTKAAAAASMAAEPAHTHRPAAALRWRHQALAQPVDHAARGPAVQHMQYMHTHTSTCRCQMECSRAADVHAGTTTSATACYRRYRCKDLRSYWRKSRTTSV